MLIPGQLRNELHRLDGEPADSLESETLEFKSWNPAGSAHKAQVREIRETVVAFANAQGGLLVLGVADRKRTRAEAIHGVGSLDADGLRRDIYDGTEPHILTEIYELQETEGRVLVIRVPPGMPPHTTSDGVARIRVGKESKPLTGSNLANLVVSRGRRDLTAEILPDVCPSDLDPDQFRRLRSLIRADAERSDLAELDDKKLTEALGLTSDGGITLAAVLLLGSRPTLSRCVPRHELVFSRSRGRTGYDVRRDLRTPLLETLEGVRSLLDANLRVMPIGPAGFHQLEIPDITWWIAREAVLNALVHRDYFLHQSIHLRLSDNHIEITSPGGFIGGVTAQNILRHPPVRRNPLLADVLQTIGLVNRLGLGVDRIFEESLSLGKDLPRYEADESHVKLVLPTRTHADFARFVQDMRSQGRELGVDDLIVLRGLVRRPVLDRWSAARVLQLSEDEAAATLVSLRERGFLVPQGRGRGTKYGLARRYSGLVERTNVDGDIWLDEESVRLRLLAVLAERGRMTNAEIRRMSGYSRTQVLKLMSSLRREGLVQVRGRGRGAHYVPASGHGRPTAHNSDARFPLSERKSR